MKGWLGHGFFVIIFLNREILTKPLLAVLGLFSSRNYMISFWKRILAFWKETEKITLKRENNINKKLFKTNKN